VRTPWVPVPKRSMASPRFRASASDRSPKGSPAQPAAFATGVLPDLYAFHRYTGNSTGLYRSLDPPYREQTPGLSPGLSLPTHESACARFTPSNSEQRSRPPSYRGCWHGVSRRFLPGYRHAWRLFALTPFVPGDSGLHPEGLPPARGVAASAFRPLRKIPHCCLP